MTLTRVKLERFTAFDSLDLPLSPGINVFVGANGTGKTHLMKVCYAACDVSKKPDVSFATKLVNVFLPSGRSPSRLVRKHVRSTKSSVEVSKGFCSIKATISSRTRTANSVPVEVCEHWHESPIDSVYIPVKEMLSNAPGFRSLYAAREVHFEEIYADILDRAYLPPPRGPAKDTRRKLLSILQEALEGKVAIENEEFFLQNKQGKLEFSLLAEGLRKLGLLWLLIQNGTLNHGSILFWDEPETNLNPKLFGPVMNILLELQRDGVQVFLATHDYVILEELDLRKREGDEVAFHSLYREHETERIACNTSGNYVGIHPNAIADAFDDLYDRKIELSLRQGNQ